LFFGKGFGMVLCPGVRGVQPLTTLSLERKKIILVVYYMTNRVKKCLDWADAWTTSISTATLESALAELKSKGLIFEAKPDQFEVLK
jgi:hypothetical protein